MPGSNESTDKKLTANVQSSPSQQVPREVLKLLFSWLDCQSLLRAERVCTTWKNIINSKERTEKKTLKEMAIETSPFTITCYVVIDKQTGSSHVNLEKQTFTMRKNNSEQQRYCLFENLDDAVENHHYTTDDPIIYQITIRSKRVADAFKDAVKNPSLTSDIPNKLTNKIYITKNSVTNCLWLIYALDEPVECSLRNKYFADNNNQWISEFDKSFQDLIQILTKLLPSQKQSEKNNDDTSKLIKTLSEETFPSLEKIERLVSHCLSYANLVRSQPSPVQNIYLDFLKNKTVLNIVEKYNKNFYERINEIPDDRKKNNLLHRFIKR